MVTPTNIEVTPFNNFVKLLIVKINRWASLAAELLGLKRNIVVSSRITHLCVNRVDTYAFLCRLMVLRLHALLTRSSAICCRIGNLCVPLVQLSNQSECIVLFTYVYLRSTHSTFNRSRSPLILSVTRFSLMLSVKH